jgi:hypothetical protein
LGVDRWSRNFFRSSREVGGKFDYAVTMAGIVEDLPWSSISAPALEELMYVLLGEMGEVERE